MKVIYQTLKILGITFCLFPRLTYAQTGPGGVGHKDGSSELELWLVADSTVTSIGTVGNETKTFVESWTDISGNGNDLVAPNSNNRPWLEESIFNGWPAVRLIDDPSYLLGPETSTVLGGDTDTELTIYTVHRNPDQYFAGGYVVSLKYSTNGAMQSLMSISQNIFQATNGYNSIGLAGMVYFDDSSISRYFSDDNGGAGYGSADMIQGVLAKPYEVSVMYVNGDDFPDIYNIDEEIDPTGVDELTIGCREPGSRNMKGYIAEAIIFSRKVNEAERLVIENYLAAKYGIAVSTDYYSYESTHYFDLAGISQENGGEQHTESKSSLITISSADLTANGSHFFVGHDNGSISSYERTEVPASNAITLEREWRVDFDGLSNNENILFDLDFTAISDSDLKSNAQYDTYYLLVDSDGDFSSTNDQNAYELDSNGDYTLHIDSLSPGDYLKIAVAARPQTPQNFTAQSDMYERATLSWDAATEDILGYPLIPVGDIMYNVYQDGVLVETTTNTTTTLIGLANEISYDFTVEAFMASVPLSSNSVSTSATPGLIISWDTTSTSISYNTLDDRWELRISENETSQLDLDVVLSDGLGFRAPEIEFDVTVSNPANLNSLTTPTISITNPGSGYAVGEQFTDASGGGSVPAVIRVDVVDGSGGVTGYSFISGGMGYPYGSGSFILSDSNKGAQIEVTVQNGSDFTVIGLNGQRIGTFAASASSVFTFGNEFLTTNFKFDIETDVEPDEPVTLTIDTTNLVGMGSFLPELKNETLYVVIVDDDNPRKIHFPSTTASVSEPSSGSTSVSIDVAIPLAEVDPNNATTAKYMIKTTSSAGTSDHDLIDGGIVTIPAGATSTTIDFNVLADSEYDPDETIILRLIEPTNSSLGDDPGTNVYNEIEITITDGNEPTLDFAAASYDVAEDGSGSVTLTVNSNIIAKDAYDVNLTLGSGTTATIIADYIFNSSFEFPAGLTNASYTISNIQNDQIFEGNEYIDVELAAGTDYQIGTSIPSTTITIIEDDPPPVAHFPVTQFYDLETNSGNQTITVQQDRVASTANTITYSVESPSLATSGVDYTNFTEGTVIISAGSTSSDIILNLVDDNEIEGPEPIQYTLTGSSIGGSFAASDSVVFTILDDETGHLGPGGVGSPNNNSLWLRADRGVFADSLATTETGDQGEVVVWQDQSGNVGNEFYSVASTPLYHETISEFNDMPGIQFERSNGDYLQGPQSLFLTGLSNADLTVFVVFKHGDASAIQSDIFKIFDEDDESSMFVASTNKINGSNPSDHVGIYTNGINSWLTHQDVGNYSYDVPILMMADVSASGKELFTYGTSQASSSSGIVPSSSHTEAATIGYSGRLTSNPYYLDGEIAEIIVYNKRLNVVERIIVENALAAKYGMLGSIANSLFNASSTYINDIAGIGRSGSIEHNVAKGASPLTVSDPSNLDEEEYLFWGENGLDGMDEDDVEVGEIDNRWSKVWQFHEDSDVGNVTLTFYRPISEGDHNDVKLLVDEDGIFNTGATRIDATSFDATAGTFTFENVDIEDGWFYTLGSIDSRTPLPVTLTDYSITEYNGIVSIDWTVSTEINNEGFTIEKSDDGQSWHPIGFVPGTGDSSLPTQYSLQDHDPSSPITYYRCIQRDFDGASEIIFVGRIDIENEPDQKHIVYPNPIINGEINILKGTGNPVRILVHGPTGQPIDYRLVEETQRQIKLKLTQAGYPYYVLSIQNENGSIERRILLNQTEK